MNMKLLSSIFTLTITMLATYSNISHAQEDAEQLMDNAIKSLTEACNTYGNGGACALVSQAYYDGLVVEQDYKTSLRFSSKGCDKVKKPHGVSCYLAGSDYDSDIFLTEDYAEGHKYYLKGCKLNDHNSCNEIAVNFENGYGVDEDPEQAEAFYKKACKLGSKLACDEL